MLLMECEGEHTMKSLLKFISVFLIFSLVGCSNMSRSEQRIVSGAVIGTAGGALIGGGRGALIGAGAGAIGGAIYDSANPDY